MHRLTARKEATPCCRASRALHPCHITRHDNSRIETDRLRVGRHKTANINVRRKLSEVLFFDIPQMRAADLRHICDLLQLIPTEKSVSTQSNAIKLPAPVILECIVFFNRCIQRSELLDWIEARQLTLLVVSHFCAPRHRGRIHHIAKCVTASPLRLSGNLGIVRFAELSI